MEPEPRQNKTQLKYSTYLDERKSLVSTEHEVSSRFDKSILTLSGGAMLLSMTFVKDIADKPDGAGILLVAWLLLAGAISVMLVSLLTSQSALRKQRDILDQVLEDSGASNASNPFARATHYLNISSIVAFIVALVFMAIFVKVNLPGEKSMSKEEPTTNRSVSENDLITRGFVPQRPPKPAPGHTDPSRDTGAGAVPQNPPKPPPTPKE